MDFTSPFSPRAPALGVDPGRHAVLLDEDNAFEKARLNYFNIDLKY
jgi:hypothetical protein